MNQNYSYSLSDQQKHDIFWYATEFQLAYVCHARKRLKITVVNSWGNHTYPHIVIKEKSGCDDGGLRGVVWEHT